VKLTDLRRLLGTGAREGPAGWRDAYAQWRLDQGQAGAVALGLVVAAVMVVAVLARFALVTSPTPAITGACLGVAIVGLAVAGLGRRPAARTYVRLLVTVPVLAILAHAVISMRATGGLAGPAWPTLLLVVVGVPLLLPFTPAQMSVMAALTWGALGLGGAGLPAPPGGLADRVIWLLLATLVGLAASKVTEDLRRRDFQARFALEEEQKRTEQLLLNILPPLVAERLKSSDAAIAEAHEEVTVLFADIVGFTPLAATRGPGEMVELLDELFSRFDDLAREHDLEKIKTIGDCYMAAAGLPLPQPAGAAAAAAMALDLVDAVDEFGRERGVDLQVRVGLHTGPAVAGVIGRAKFAYDVWGDSVNLASRLESHGVPGRVQVSAAVAERLEGRFRCEARGPVDLKGKGAVETFLLAGPVEVEA